MSKECPKCHEKLEDVGSGYRCSGLTGCWYFEKKEIPTNLPTEPIEIDANKYKDAVLLKKKFPSGYEGYKLVFRVSEFEPVNPRGERKFLHVHVKIKKGRMDLLEVRVPKIPLIIEYENHHIEKNLREDWKRIIRDNMKDIMGEIKQKLSVVGINLSDWKITEY